MKFAYTALSKDGKTLTGEVVATSVFHAQGELKQQGLVPISVAEMVAKELPWYRKDIVLVPAKLGDRELAAIARSLGTLLDSGVSISDALEISALAQTKPQHKTALEEVLQHLTTGQSLGKAFAYAGTIFPQDFINLVAIGHETNSLPVVLADANIFYEQRAETRQKIVSALIYPAILLCAGIALLAVLTLVLVPAVEPLFDDAGADKPPVFAFLSSLRVMLSNWGAFIAAIFIGAILLLFVWSRSSTGRQVLQQVVSRVPLFGPMNLRQNLQQDSKNGALLIRAGMTLPDVFRSISNSTSHTKLTAIFKAVSQKVAEGEKASTALGEFPILPRDFIALAEMAERTNKWPEILNSYAKAASLQNDTIRERMLGVLTPAITLVLGLTAGFLVFSVVSALLEINAIAIPV